MYKSESEFSISFEILHHKKFLVFLTMVTYFLNLLLNSRLMPPDYRHAAFDKDLAMSELIASNPGISKFTLLHVSVRNKKSVF
jgi:hypothetical protein